MLNKYKPRAVILHGNTFSISYSFRLSLVKRLVQKNMLQMVVSSSADVESIPSDYLEFSRIYMLTPRGIWSLFLAMKGADKFVFHGFTHTSNIVGIFVALFSLGKIPVICTITGMGRVFSYDGLLGSVGRSSIKLLYFCAQFFVRVIIVQNKDDYLEIKRLLTPLSRSIIRITAGSGIPRNYFCDIQRKPELVTGLVNIGFFSRALSEKGVWSFFRLAAMYAEANQLRFIHVGLPGVNELHGDKIGLTAAEYNVSYMGHAHDLRPWLLATDIVVIPSSYREGVSRLLIESMLAGKVVVAKLTTGVRDHLVNGVNGIVYRDDSELYAAVERALSALDGPIPENAKAYAKKYFDVALVDQVYLDAYKQCGLEI